jgi:hypothetical protein
MHAETRHASVRRQQRSIPLEAVDLLWEFGTVARANGADCLFFDRVARQRAATTIGRNELRRAERYLNAYAVVADDGAVITVAWRTRRLRRA